MNLSNVSDGLGSHLPDPCSEQLGPLATMVPAGNKNISTNRNPPWASFWATSKLIIAFCISFNALGGYILANSIRRAILTISLA